MIKAETYNVNIVNIPWEICLEKELRIEQWFNIAHQRLNEPKQMEML